ncbi:SRPBCC domain-containing protein [Flavobacterium sp.]
MNTNSNLLFDFKFDKENKTVSITREFAADRDLVWEAWTNPEILDQWWAPKPLTSRTKSMEFKVGGRRIYAMIGTEGQENWSTHHFTAVNPKDNFKFLSSFTDSNGNPNSPFAASEWEVNFSGQDEITTVNILIKRDSLEELEKLLEMGFREGFTSTLDYLSQYIEAKFKLRRQNKTTKKARVCTYLNFPGNTEEAFLFYKSVFKTEFVNGITRFEDIRAEQGHPPVPESIKKMVLHIELPTLGGHILMATDAPKEMGFSLNSGNNMHICLEPESREEGKRLFDELSAGGNVTMPLEDMFFGAYFGEFTDKYGINWMINVASDKKLL